MNAPAAAPPGTAQARALEIGHTRMVMAAVAFAVVFLVIGGRLAELALVAPGSEPQIAASDAGAPASTERADIVDRNGVLLATSLATASLYANTKIVPNPAEAARRLTEVLPELNEAELRHKLESGRGFVWLHRHLTPRQHYAVNALGIPGLDFQREERRVYPSGALAAHVLGFTDVDNRGLAGIERSFDKELRGSRVPVALSIDSRLQHVLRSELESAVSTFRAKGAAGLILDAHTGEVLAMVSLPDFDPNQSATMPEGALFNRTTLGVYEMGSTFKIFTIAQALDNGAATLASSYDATNPIRISRFVISDYHPQRRWLTVPEIFMHSSNIGAARMARETGPAAQRAFLDKLGLLREAPIELPEKGRPQLPSPWGDISTLTIAYGHGLSVTPLQHAAAVAAVINGGILHTPTLIKRRAEDTSAGTRVISAQTSEHMRQLMRMVVESGTGKKAEASGYLVGGKTGTAEKATRRGYNRRALLSSFVGAFPMNDPRYVVLVVLDEPQGTKETQGFATAGWVSAPVVGNVAKRLAPIAGLAPVNQDSVQQRQELRVDANGRGKPDRLASY